MNDQKNIQKLMGKYMLPTFTISEVIGISFHSIYREYTKIVHILGEIVYKPLIKAYTNQPQ